MDFLADENFPLSSVRLLREAGHRVVSIIHEAPGSKDEAILRRAHTERLIIFAPSTPSEPAEILLNVIVRPGLSVTGKFTIVERGRVRQRSLHISQARPFENE